jgi:hypothetical protein
MDSRHILKIPEDSLELLKLLVSKDPDMQDATNYLNNIGKPKEDQTFLVSVSFKELELIDALADSYYGEQHNNRIAEGIASESKSILSRLNRD